MNCWLTFPKSIRLTFVLGLLALLTLGVSASAATAAGDLPVEQQPSNTPVSGFLFPTATPTMIGGPTATPSRTPTPVPVLAEIFGNPTNLRTGPGMDFDVLAELQPGLMLPIIGRWLGYDWYLVAWADGPDGKAWVYAPLVIVRGDITTVPAVTPPAPPTVDPTQAAIQATATLLLQTPGAAETATTTALFIPTGVFTQPPALEGQAAAGPLPTFTPPQPYIQPDVLPEPQTAQLEQGGIAPAAVIISLAAMGMLTLVVGLLRRLF